MLRQKGFSLIELLIGGMGSPVPAVSLRETPMTKM
jgi:hypothetical protein